MRAKGGSFAQSCRFFRWHRLYDGRNSAKTTRDVGYISLNFQGVFCPFADAEVSSNPVCLAESLMNPSQRTSSRATAWLRIVGLFFIWSVVACRAFAVTYYVRT